MQSMTKECAPEIKKEFSKGVVFSSEWIIESIRANKLLLPQNFIKFIIGNEGKKMSFSRTKFTIREIIKIFDVVFKNPYKRNKNPHYW